MKRKKPQEKIIKALLARSGNLCAFPGCNHIIINENNDLVAQLCHIEAISENGPRFNPNLNEEEINSYSNLVFFCYRHHKEIDIDTEHFTTEKIKKIKDNHEKRFLENPYQFNLSIIHKIIDEYSSFWENIQFQYNNNHKVLDPDMKIEINFNANILDLFNELYELIKLNNNLLSKLDKSSDSLNYDFLSLISELGYDVKKAENFPYYKNPFINRDWECRKIGINNIRTKLTIVLKQLEIKCYENYLLLNPNDSNVKQKLREIQSHFEELAVTTGYID